MTVKSYYYQIDVVRFLAAFVVALFHLGWSTWTPGSGAALLVQGAYRIPEMEFFVWWGAVGVQIFFVISGFVIAGSANGATPMSFLRGRLERLYPAIWICAPITAVIWLISGTLSPSDLISRFAKSIVLSPAGPWIDGPYWTLIVEIFFYFLTFCLLLTGSFRRLEQFAICLTAYSVVFNLIYFADALGMQGLAWVHIFAEGKLKPLLPYYGVLFALGIFMWLDRSNLLGFGGKIAALAALVVGAVQIAEWSAHKYPTHPWSIPPIVWLISCTVIHYAKWTPSPPTAAFVRKLGLTTYPLYLIHFTLGVWLIRRLVDAGLAPLHALAVALSSVVIISYTVANKFEPIVKGALRRVLVKVDSSLQNMSWASSLYGFGGRLGPPVAVQATLAN